LPLSTPRQLSRLEAARELRLFIPILLGSLCGMRRGEIAALRWDAVKFDQGHIAIVAAVEQTKAGRREKEAKGHKCRTVAMPTLLVEELRAWRIKQAQELVRLGMRPDANTRVVTQTDEPHCSRAALPMRFPAS
jgi:integrase